MCDLNGTFALKISMKMTWTGLAFGTVEDGTNVPFYSWALQSQTYDSNGNLDDHDDALRRHDARSVRHASGDGEAYGQYFPNHIWGTANMPKQTIDVALPDARATKPFQTANAAVLFGIRLTDMSGNPNPLGPWPSQPRRSRLPDGRGDHRALRCRRTAAAWRTKYCWDTVRDRERGCAYRSDDDNDGVTGITSLVVPPGGVNTDSPLSFGANSVDCRRMQRRRCVSRTHVIRASRTGRPVDGSTKFYTASRTISRFDGTITNCDRIEGPVKGPRASNTQVQADFRFYGCADNSADNVCSIDVLDDNACRRRQAVADQHLDPERDLRDDARRG